HAGLGLAVLLVARHPADLAAQGRGVALHVLDDEQGVHPARRPGGRVDLDPARVTPVDVHRPGVPAGGGGLRAADPAGPAAREPGAADRAAGAVPGHPVRPHPRVPGPRHPGQPADQRGDRRSDHRRRGPRAVAELRGDGGGELPAM
ncbi:MAG: Various polyols ABC transporter, substrate-binding protein, partial [uncultured Actinomycetospora sp.]